MKKVSRSFVSIALAITLVLSMFSLSFATGGNDEYYYVDNVVLTDRNSGGISTLGVDPPTTVFDLRTGSYSGSVYFDSSVYTNRRFSNHGGSITVSTDFTCDSFDPDITVTVRIVQKNLIGETYVASADVSAKRADSVTFTGLNSSKNYYVQFVNPYSQIATPISGTFTVSR